MSRCQLRYLTLLGCNQIWEKGASLHKMEPGISIPSTCSKPLESGPFCPRAIVWLFPIVWLWFLQEDAQLYGVDWDGPMSTAAGDPEGVQVPSTERPMGDNSFAQLVELINPLSPSSNYGIDLYLSTLAFVNSTTHQQWKLPNRCVSLLLDIILVTAQFNQFKMRLLWWENIKHATRREKGKMVAFY